MPVFEIKTDKKTFIEKGETKGYGDTIVLSNEEAKEYLDEGSLILYDENALTKAAEQKTTVQVVEEAVEPKKKTAKKKKS